MFPLNDTTKVACSVLLLGFFIITVQPWNLYFLNDDFVHIPLSTQSVLIHFQFFRPVPNMLTALEVRIFGTAAVGFHVTSMILHIVATICVGVFCHSLIQQYSSPGKYKNAGYLASLLFFIYPFHSEPVMWIIGRIGIIATIFILLSLIFFLKRHHRRYFYYCSLLSFLVALFTYETSWVVPLFITMFALVDYSKTRKYGRLELMPVLGFWVIFVFFLLTRFAVLQEIVTDYEFSGHHISPASLINNFFRLVGRTLVPPSISTTKFLITIGLVMIILLVYLVFLIRRKSFRFLYLLLAILLGISFLPTTQIGIDTHGSEGERYIYLPSVFWIILLTGLLYELPIRVGQTIFVVLIFLYSVLFMSAASNYHYASSVAKKLVSLVRDYRGEGKIVAINIPANFRGALIFRSGFKEAIDWVYPQLKYDSVIAVPAERTNHKIKSIAVIDKADLGRMYPFSTTDNKTYAFHSGSQPIHLNMLEDMLIYFDASGDGVAIYPGSN